MRPLASSESQVSTEQDETTSHLQVWMVDDDPNDLLFLELAITEAELDAEVTYINDGAKLVERLHAASEKQFPSIVVLDLMMPGVNGHDVLELLQQDPTLWPIPVVIFSHSSRLPDKVKGFDRGARWFRTKPSDFAAMVEFAESLPVMAHAASVKNGVLGDDAVAALGLGSDTVSRIEAALRTVNWEDAGEPVVRHDAHDVEA